MKYYVISIRYTEGDVGRISYTESDYERFKREFEQLQINVGRAARVILGNTMAPETGVLVVDMRQVKAVGACEEQVYESHSTQDLDQAEFTIPEDDELEEEEPEEPSSFNPPAPQQ